jgi:hypothetical protein
MQKLIRLTLLSSIVFSASVFAQARIDINLKAKTTTIKKLVNQNIDRLTVSEKREMNIVLASAVTKIKQIINAQTPLPTPRPRPRPRQGSNLKCQWQDGSSNGIGQRGHHIVETIRGLKISKAFFGNNGIYSNEKCLNELIDLTVQPHQIGKAKTKTCACKWFDGNSFNKPTKRGFHMSYNLNLQGGLAVILSSKFYGNGGTNSQQRCQNELVATNFSCRL